jgi:hypothetical protein
MKTFKRFAILFLLAAFIQSPPIRLEAATFVTDTGGFAYDESRASTNIAPAIALGTVALVAIIAVAVQNTHSSSSSHSHAHFSSSGS